MRTSGDIFTSILYIFLYTRYLYIEEVIFSLLLLPWAVRHRASALQARESEDVDETLDEIYTRAVDAFAASDPVQTNRALACVYLPEDVIEGMRSEVRAGYHFAISLQMLEAVS
jgi:hypothetical protein